MKNILFIFIFLITSASFAQETENDSLQLTMNTDVTLNKNVLQDPLAPSKAAFYSAVLPGLGQAYNKKYWKIPIVYAAIGTSLYYYSWNNKKYHEYRDAYKTLLAGGTVTGELADIGEDRLIRAQKFHQKNRDLSMLLALGFYVLNIVEANVNAHLMQFNVNDNLSLRPQLQQNQIDYKHNMGLTLSYQF
ncbi:DUF5683 domain-containing protein [Flavobacterium beibuense]|uniref:DUF5683 domain-containing protein n=1 Tax=Flavobacterium beibuense TaxID=657326 RepID=UPI003A95B57C